MDRDYACSQLRVALLHLAPKCSTALLAVGLKGGNSISNEVVAIYLVVLLHPERHRPDFMIARRRHQIGLIEIPNASHRDRAKLAMTFAR